jgi:hypothetical protein
VAEQGRVDVQRLRQSAQRQTGQAYGADVVHGPLEKLVTPGLIYGSTHA